MKSLLEEVLINLQGSEHVGQGLENLGKAGRSRDLSLAALGLPQGRL